MMQQQNDNPAVMEFDIQSAIADFHMAAIRNFLRRLEAEAEDSEYSEFRLEGEATA